MPPELRTDGGELNDDCEMESCGDRLVIQATVNISAIVIPQRVGCSGARQQYRLSSELTPEQR